MNTLGTLEQSELRQYLNGPPLEIEVHDRDRKPEGVKLKPTLFGDDLEDEKISNVGTVASKSSVFYYMLVCISSFIDICFFIKKILWFLRK